MDTLVDTLKLVVKDNTSKVYKINACDSEWELIVNDVYTSLKAGDIMQQYKVEIIVEGDVPLYNMDGTREQNQLITQRKSRIYEFNEGDKHIFYREDLTGMHMELRFYK